MSTECLMCFQDSGIGSEKGDSDVSCQKSGMGDSVKVAERVAHVKLNDARQKMGNICKFTKKVTRNGLILKKARLQKAKIPMLLKRIGTPKAREETMDLKHYLRQRININNSTNMFNVGAQGNKTSPKHAAPRSPIKEVQRVQTRVAKRGSPTRKSARSLSPLRRSVKVRSPQRKSVINLRSNDKTPTVNATVRALRPRATPKLKDMTLSQGKKRRCYTAFVEDTLEMTMTKKRQCRHTIG